MAEINVSFIQIQMKLPGRHHDTHVPDLFLGKWPGYALHSRWDFITDKIGQVKVAALIQRHPYVFAITPFEHDCPALNHGLAEIDSILRVRGCLPKYHMPFAIGPEGL